MWGPKSFSKKIFRKFQATESLSKIFFKIFFKKFQESQFLPPRDPGGRIFPRRTKVLKGNFGPPGSWGAKIFPKKIFQKISRVGEYLEIFFKIIRISSTLGRLLF
jgi:hypothetical protein